MTIKAAASAAAATAAAAAVFERLSWHENKT